MQETEYIESVDNKYLIKYQQKLVNELVMSITNKHRNFEPYKINPKHYIISTYEPLELHYVLLGKNNFGISIEFQDDQLINSELVSRFNLEESDGESIYNPRVIQLKREIEYYFLSKALNAVQITIGQKIQLYITQHGTEVSYDISNKKSIDPDYLWENLEE